MSLQSQLTLLDPKSSRIPFFHCKLYEHGASILILPARFRSSKNRVSSPLAKYFQNLPSLLSVNLAVITSLVVTTKPGNKFVSSTIYFCIQRGSIHKGNETKTANENERERFLKPGMICFLLLHVGLLKIFQQFSV